MRTLVLAIVALAACNGGDTSGTTSDGGGWTDGSAKVTLTVYRLGVETDALVTLTGTEQSYTANSGETVEVIAPDQYTATSGDGAFTSQFGYPVHTDDAGEFWATAPLNVEVEDGVTVEDGIDMFKLFEPGVYSCSFDYYRLDMAAVDYKGEYINTFPLDPQRISIDAYGQVKAEDDPNMGVLATTQDVYAEGEHLTLVEGKDGFGSYISSSSVGNDTFSLAHITESLGSIKELTCSK